jgi:hypothetical protein
VIFFIDFILNKSNLNINNNLNTVIMANEFNCKNCGYNEGSHDAFAEAQQRASNTEMVGAIEYAIQLKKEFHGICNNYEKTDEEIQFDKDHPCYIR